MSVRDKIIKGGGKMVQFTLEAARVNSGLNQKEASALLGIHHQTLSKYEKDSRNIPFSLLDKMSKLYKVPKDHIFLGIKYEKNSTV